MILAFSELNKNIYFKLGDSVDIVVAGESN